MEQFNEQTGSNNPFDGFSVGLSSTPTFADVDGDGDFDAVVGAGLGTLRYYENQGTATSPIYVAQTGSNNPFDGFDVGFSSTPTFGDLDGDGDLDAVVGEGNGNLNYYENTGSATNPIYLEQTATNNPFNGIDVGSRSAPTFGDVDGDGDLDAVVGENGGTLRYYENTGSATNPIYLERTGTNNPFDSIDVGSASTPALADVDEDGDLDVVVGEISGNLRYYENTGSAINPIYQEQTGSNNPFNGIDVGFRSAPTLADVDGDEQLEVVVGELLGNLNYYQNDLAPEPVDGYEEVTGSNNPLNGFDVGYFSKPTFADLDGDGDLDAVVGEYEGNLNYYENIGDAISPNYIEQTGSNNPLNSFDVGIYSAPTFADVDGDGDLDVVVGEEDRILNYYLNGIPEEPTPPEPVDGYVASYRQQQSL